MSLIDLLSWDAFGSGWFWSLVVLQWFWHGAQVLGVPADCLHCKDNAQLSMVMNWRAKRRLRSAHRAPLVFLAGLSFLVSVVFILGFVYHIEICAASALLIVPEVIIFQLGYRTAQSICVNLYRLEESIKALKTLHLKIYATGAMAIFVAGLFGYAFEVLKS